MIGWRAHHAQDAAGFGTLSTSTRHIRQLPAIINFSCRGANVSIPEQLMLTVVGEDAGHT